MISHSADQLKEAARAALRETIEAKDVAELLGLSEWKVYDLVRRRLIPHIRVGTRRVLFRRSSLLAWLEAQEQASVAVEVETVGKIRRLK